MHTSIFIAPGIILDCDGSERFARLRGTLILRFRPPDKFRATRVRFGGCRRSLPIDYLEPRRSAAPFRQDERAVIDDKLFPPREQGYRADFHDSPADSGEFSGTSRALVRLAGGKVLDFDRGKIPEGCCHA